MPTFERAHARRLAPSCYWRKNFGRWSDISATGTHVGSELPIRAPNCLISRLRPRSADWPQKEHVKLYTVHIRVPSKETRMYIHIYRHILVTSPWLDLWAWWLWQDTTRLRRHYYIQLRTLYVNTYWIWSFLSDDFRPPLTFFSANQRSPIATSSGYAVMVQHLIVHTVRTVVRMLIRFIFSVITS
jgi:hypothetical protein